MNMLSIDNLHVKLADEERTISPQEIVRRLLGQGLGLDG